MIGEDGEPTGARRAPEPARARTHSDHEAVLCYRLRSSGDERWSVVRSTPILTPEGHVQLVINVFRDVTEERDAEARLHFLAEAGSLLSASLDYEATLADLAGLLVPRIADYCIVDAVDEDGTLRQVVISHRSDEREELLRELRRRYPPEANDAHPVSQVLRTRKPYLVDDARTGELEHAAVDEEHLALYEALGAVSYIVVPLEARGRLLGRSRSEPASRGVALVSTDLEVAHEIARRAALAIDNALLFQAAQESYAQLDTMLRSARSGLASGIASFASSA
jgi:GAF domain-containing protein